MNIKNVIFDLGGVLLPLDMNTTSAAFKNLGARDFDKVYSFFKQENFFDLFDKGLISEEEFRNELKNFLPSTVSVQQIDDAWNAMLNPIPKKRIDFINTFRQSFHIFLLSNTNAIHVKEFLAVHDAEYGNGAFFKLFHKVYFSNEIGMRKPDVETFDFVIHNSQLQKSETIFIDDTLHHVEGARKAGLKAYHLDTSKQDVESLIKEVGLIK